MLPSSGCFSDVSCPVSTFCERPHCWFRHTSGRRQQLVTEIQSSLIDSTGHDNPRESTHKEDHPQSTQAVRMDQLQKPARSVGCKSLKDEREGDALPGPSQHAAERLAKRKRFKNMRCAACHQGPYYENLIDLTGGQQHVHTQTCPDTPPRPDSSTAATEGLVEISDDEIIVIQSNSEDEDEPDSSDADSSDSDPMEECYNIFVNEQARRNKEDVALIKEEESAGELVEANETEPTESSPERRSEPPSAKISANLQLAPVQDSCVQYIAETVIDVGNNLCLILAAPGSSSTAGPVLTPISRQQTTPIIVKQTHRPPTQRCTKSTVLIPAQARKPPQSSSTSITPTPLTATSPTVKPQSCKRKSKQQPEGPKVPDGIRQKYVNDFTAEFCKTAASVDDAFSKALDLERSVYNRSVNALKYRSVAVNALKSLKNQRAVATKDDSKASSQTKGNIPLNLHKCKDDAALYEALRDYVVSEEMLSVNYPAEHPEKPGSAVLSVDTKKCNDSCKRICCRCGATYVVSKMGKHVRLEECNYHYGKAVRSGVARGNEMRFTCCEGVLGTPGCQTFKFHVHDTVSLDGFVSTAPRAAFDLSCPGIFSLDCEMCYTINGRELSRVTLVNSSLQVIYDTFVRPVHEVLDYDTRFTGISEDDVKGQGISLGDVQETLLSFISDDTILVGHSLETDLCALKLFHRTVVDTSVVFPHPLGPPHKLSLNSLTAEYLRKIIQEEVNGHDTAEDATAAMELMIWKVKKDAKLKK